MNGLSVMSCVQNVQTGTNMGYGRTGMQAAYGGVRTGLGQNGNVIRISGAGTRAAGTAHADAKARTAHAVPAQTVSRCDAWYYPEQKSLPRGTRSAEQPRVKNVPRNGRSSSGRSRHGSVAVRGIILALLFAAMLAGFQTMTGASSRKEAEAYKYYTTVTLGYGEDITDIVYRYCDSSQYATPDAYIREICGINSLPYHKGELPALSAGTKIVIPYYDTELK